MDKKILRIATLVIVAVLLVALFMGVCRVAAGFFVATTESEDVEVEIIDAQYSSGIALYLQSDKHRIVVSYNEDRYTIHGEDIYYAYKDRVGETVSATFTTYTYKNGSISCKIELP